MIGKYKAVLLVVIALILVSSYIGVAYACFEAPYFGFDPRGKTELKIKDQDEPWKNGVFTTWTASNLAPGDELTFSGCFVGLLSQSSVKNSPGTVGITCNYNPWKPWQPDNMAKYMVITRCIYSYTYLNQSWQIDCLTGKSTRVSPPGGGILPANINWQIQDADRDGKITFHDLKMKQLTNIPLYSANEARFEMSVAFSKDAGNEFQNSVFNLTMFYALSSW